MNINMSWGKERCGSLGMRGEENSVGAVKAARYCQVQKDIVRECFSHATERGGDLSETSWFEILGRLRRG